MFLPTFVAPSTTMRSFSSRLSGSTVAARLECRLCRWFCPLPTGRRFEPVDGRRPRSSCNRRDAKGLDRSDDIEWGQSSRLLNVRMSDREEDQTELVYISRREKKIWEENPSSFFSLFEPFVSVGLAARQCHISFSHHSHIQMTGNELRHLAHGRCLTVLTRIDLITRCRRRYGAHSILDDDDDDE